MTLTSLSSPNYKGKVVNSWQTYANKKPKHCKDNSCFDHRRPSGEKGHHNEQVGQHHETNGWGERFQHFGQRMGNFFHQMGPRMGFHGAQHHAGGHRAH